MIQRDYAQGRTDKKAQEVRANLLNDIFDNEKKSIHFDLIFGSCENRKENDGEKHCFIPVDGQQRLTTLFLLYLYGQKAGETNTELDLSKFSYDTRRAATDFCESITRKEWSLPNDKKVSDVIKDSVWFMNYWENDPTVAGMLNMLDAIHEKAEESKAKERSFPNLERIQFYFFDLEASGLNENLYLKMNSRGKPLTAFENLKASIEKVLPDNIKSDNAKNCFPENSDAQESFKEKWKSCMDDDWINAFWDSEHPESTDRSITAFLVRFLSGYYKAYNEVDKISEDLKGINSEENYADFIPFECIKPILCLDGVFTKLARAFTTIGDVAKIKPSWDETITPANLSEYKIIAVVFTYVLFDGDKDAMRFAWNMVENTVTGYDTFIAYCKRVAEILKYRNNEKHANKDFYEVLSSIKFDNPSAQLIEEVAKAKQIHHGEPRSDGKSWEDLIVKAENHAFFKGSIRFLFTDDNGSPDWQNFETKWCNAYDFFNKNGIAKRDFLVNYISSLSDDDIIYLGTEHGFSKESSIWKSILLDQRLRKATNTFLMNQAVTNDFSKLKKQLLLLLNNISSNLRLLRDWKNNDVVLTDYSVRRDTPNNGYVYAIGSQRHNIVSSLKNLKNTDITIEIPSNNSGEEFYSDERSAIICYRGLYATIYYKNYPIRFEGNDKLFLMEKDDPEKYMTDASGDKYCRIILSNCRIDSVIELMDDLINSGEKSTM